MMKPSPSWKPKLTTLDVTKSWATQWLSLAAWRAPLDGASLTFNTTRKTTTRLGTAWVNRRKAVVYPTGNISRDLAITLHELAHLAAPSYTHHELPWCEIYAAAAAEATRVDVHLFDLETSITDLDAQVMAAIDDWLARSGQLTVLRAVGVLK